MSKSDVREFRNRLVVIIEHLLKIKYVKSQIGLDNLRGWEQSVKVQQTALADHIGSNPGVKPKIDDVTLDTAYRRALRNLISDYPGVQFPRIRQLSLENIVGKKR